MKRLPPLWPIALWWTTVDWIRSGFAWLNAHGNAVMAIVTTVYALVTILLWLATRRQADAAAEQARLTRQQADLTRTIFEATHRPELSVEPYFAQPANPGHIHLSFRVVNHGRMAAIIKVWSARLLHRDTLLAEADSLTGSFVVFPGASSEDLPSVDVRGAFAAMMWKPGHPDDVPATLSVSVSYRGAGPTVYETKIRASFWAVDLRPILKDVQHEIT